MSSVDHVPLPRPALPHDATRPGELTASQEEMYAKMLAHFDRPDYALPRAEKGELGEEEQFWLVSASSGSLAVTCLRAVLLLGVLTARAWVRVSLGSAY